MPKTSRTELLDRVLEGKSPDVKARVLDLIVRMGIDPEDEFFLIFIALGQLQVLIEDSPNEWQKLFSDFQGELRLWEESNIRTLEQLMGQVRAMEHLATSVNRLITIITPLAKNSPQLKANAAQLSKDLENLKETSLAILDARNNTMREVTLAERTLDWMKLYMPKQEKMLEELSHDTYMMRNMVYSRGQKGTESPNAVVNFCVTFGGALAALIVFQIVLVPLVTAW